MANMLGFSPFATVQHPLINAGRPTNIPTMFRGRSFEPDTAAQLIAQFSKMKNSTDPIHPETGETLTPSASMGEAQAALKGLMQQYQQAIQTATQPLSNALEPLTQQIKQGLNGLGSSLGSLGLGSGSSFFRPW